MQNVVVLLRRFVHIVKCLPLICSLGVRAGLCEPKFISPACGYASVGRKGLIFYVIILIVSVIRPVS